MYTKILSLAFLFASAFGCAHQIEPTKEPSLGPPDELELFRRARFTELSGGNPERIEHLAYETRAAAGVSYVERNADMLARTAYRDGDPKITSEALSMLGESHRTRQILGALLSHADSTRPMRRSMITEGTIDLPLAAVALDRGYPVVEAEIGGKKLRLLWDTGATENLLSPQAAELLGLNRTQVKFIEMRAEDALVVRFGATAVDQVEIGPWKIENVPLLVTELDTVENMKRDLHGVDGFLSPQLLVPQGCFAIDRNEAILTVGFDAASCEKMIAKAHRVAPLFSWEGELYTSARVHQSPEIAVQVETGSAVSFLRTHASRYLPGGVLIEDPIERDGEIAHGLREQVRILVAGRAKSVSAIDLAPTREARAHDDIATLGNDVLLQGRGIVVSFHSRSLGMLGLDSEPIAKARLAQVDSKKRKKKVRPN